MSELGHHVDVGPPGQSRGSQPQGQLRRQPDYQRHPRRQVTGRWDSAEPQTESRKGLGKRTIRVKSGNPAGLSPSENMMTTSATAKKTVIQNVHAAPKGRTMPSPRRITRIL